VSLFEFRDFASKGNAADLARDGGVAAASSAIVTSLVDDLLLLVADLSHGQHDASEPVCRGQTEQRCSSAFRLFGAAERQRLISVCSSMP